MSGKFSDRIVEALGAANVLENEAMSRHTSFRIGGPAQYFLTPDSMEKVAEAISICKEFDVPYYVIGNGSNLLVRDKGVKGAIIQIFDKLNDCTVTGNKMVAKSGILLSRLANYALKEALTGLEFASGIPGTLGGAVTMNAGAYGGEIKDVVTSVTVLDADGEIKVIPGEEMDFGYRHSVVCDKGYVVLEAELKLEKGDPVKIKERMEELKVQRTTKQPLEYPSAGSTFKRPEGYFAGKLISDAGLKGYKVGGAMVSPKHSGFVINDGGATAADTLQLIKDVQDKVFKDFGVKLEMEVKVLGEE